MPKYEPDYLMCDVWLHRETEKAYEVSKDKGGPRHWIPRSLTDGCTKFAPEGDVITGLYRFCRMKIADWKVEECDL